MIPVDYTVEKFYEFNGGVKYSRYLNNYQGSCYICKEGLSWLKKKRCYYLVEKNYICCHNCGWKGSSTDWLIEITGKTFKELLIDSKEYDKLPSSFKKEEVQRRVNDEILPKDSINLLDRKQVEFYVKEQSVVDALKLICKRRLFHAINRPKSLLLSLTDFVHKNRLVIPFYNRNKEIIFYQTRAIYPDDTKPKYLGKVNSPKSLYGIDSIDSNSDNILIFEGPINSFFMKNSVAVCGIQENSHEHLTALQTEQLRAFPLHKRVWVLDSQWIDRASHTKTGTLIEQGEQVFIWPRESGEKYKDFNDIAVDQKKNEINIDFVLSNTSSGLKAKMLLGNIKCSRK